MRRGSLPASPIDLSPRYVFFGSSGFGSFDSSGMLIFGISNFASRSPLMSARLATTR